jgi:hypothetical protein
MSDESETVAPPGEGGSQRFMARWAPQVFLAAVFLAMLAISWGKWPDVLVDFGHELYAPWQIAGGKLLGRDIAWGASGPLSPYWNALLFRVFGTGLWTLVGFNLLVLAALTAMMHRLLRDIGDACSATLASFAFLVLFGFNQYVGIGNYNYVTPYSHGATHGMALSILSLGLLYRYARTGSFLALGGASAVVGLVFLAKPELVVACAAAFALVLLVLARDAKPGRERWKVVAVGLVPALLPTTVAFLLLCFRAPASDAWRTAIMPWGEVGSPLVKTPFYLQGMGLDEPVENLARMAEGVATWAAAVAALVVLDLLVPRRPLSILAAAGAAAVAGYGGWAFLSPVDWLEIARPLPAVVLGALGWLAIRVLRTRPCKPAALLHLGLTAFAGVLLLKMALNARLYHYGFILAMPGTVLAITWIAGSLPRAVRQRGGSGWVVRATAIAAVAVLSLAYVRISSRIYERKTVAVGTGRDAFLADGRGLFVNAALQRLAAASTRQDTLAVIPEGVMINYLARRETPSPYLTYLPDAMARWGEGPLLRSLEANPPAFLLVVHRDATEHGASLFGKDYGLEMLAWMRGRYEVDGRIGGSPFAQDGYGMLLFRLRKEHAPRPDGQRGIP